MGHMMVDHMVADRMMVMARRRGRYGQKGT
jgi:hypothetical protein